MKFIELKNKIKEELKVIAQEIREHKKARKPYADTNEWFNNISDLERKQDNFRHIHIAYCMFFNKTDYSKIEKKDSKAYNKRRVNISTDYWENEIEEEVEYA